MKKRGADKERKNSANQGKAKERRDRLIVANEMEGDDDNRD